MLNKQIAAELGISEHTVKAHRARGMHRLGVSSAAELGRMLEKLGLGGG
jgi:FixJ family two-component response regulator